MPRAESAQLNIRSRFARERVSELARRTGMSATKVVEEALRAYTPPPPDAPSPDDVPPGFVRKGTILVKKAIPGQRMVTMEEINASIQEDRERRGDIRYRCED